MQALKSVTLCAFVGITVTSLAHAQETVTHSIGSRDSAVHAYWTADRMRGAVTKHLDALGGRRVPLSVPVPTGSPKAAGGTVLGENGQIKFLDSPSTAMLLKIPAQTATAGGASSPTATPTPTSGPYPGPHNTFAYGPKYRTYPISTVGKLFFTDPRTSSNFVCSATVTTGNAAINNVIWTAGHCVAAGNNSTWFTNFLFCPSYDINQGGPHPVVGCWSGSGTVSTSTAWFQNGALSRDYAAISLSSSGTKINADVATVTGGLGLAWNWARDASWVHMGYPAAAPFTGGQLIMTMTEYRYNDAPDAFGPPTLSWGSAQTGGASGSALILYFNFSGGAYQPTAVAGNFINSNVSYTYTGGPNGNETGFELQGPYYDSTTCSTWKVATGWTGTC